jgi:hypothetical protein
MQTEMRALLTLLAALLVFALGAEAAQADVRIDVWGTGTVKLGSFSCESKNANEHELGATCNVGSGLLQIFTAELTPAQRSNWGFAGWSGNCQPPTGGLAEVCQVFPLASGSITARFHDYRNPVVTLSGGPVGTVQDESASFNFSSDEPGGTYVCGLMDEEELGLCPSGTRSYSGLSRGQHVFEVRARDPSGNVSEAQQRYWFVDFDRDGDRYDHLGPGARAPLDCDDANARIYPGAPEVPENDVDEDCDGIDGTYPDIDSDVNFFSRTKAGLTTFPLLSVIRPPGGALVELRCRGRGCAFARRRRIADSETRKIAFGPSLHRTRLRLGGVLEVRIAHQGMRGKVVRLKVGRRGRVSTTTLCLRPGGTTPTSCPAG